MVGTALCSTFRAALLLLVLLVFTHGYRIPSLRRKLSCTRQHAWLPDIDIGGLSDSIGNLDQFFQGALNTASTSDSLAVPGDVSEVKNIFLESDDG